MADEITKAEVGRPTVMTDETVRKLEEMFRLGVRDTPACAYAGISRDTYYRWLKEDHSFSDRMETAKAYAIIASKHIVVNKIVNEKDLETAKWFLEKYDAKIPQQQTNTQVNVFNQLREEFTKKPETSNPEVVADDIQQTEINEAVIASEPNETK